MKHFLCVAGVLAGLWLGSAACLAQDAAAAARRQEAYEDKVRMEARVGALEEALQTLQREINSLRAQMDVLRTELARARGESAATPESIRALAAKIEEVDRKRQSDNEKVLAEFARLTKSVTRRSAVKPSASPEKMSEYTIRAGDTLYDIVKALNEEGLNLTQEQVMKANPSVKWDRLQIGQKIKIPATPPSRP